MTFGKFDTICEKTAIPLCYLVGPYDSAGNSTALAAGILSKGIMTECTVRTVVLSNTIIFNVGTAFIHIAALLVVGFIIFNVQTKYTAVGRREILDFFYLFSILTIMSMVIDAGVTAPGSGAYPYIAAVQCGLISATAVCLMMTGFIGFQWYEDGTFKSVWINRIATICGFALTFVIALFTFKEWVGFTSTSTMGLFIVLYVLNALWLVIWAIAQFTVSVFWLHNFWALSALALGAFIFVVGQVLMYAVSSTICTEVRHYIDGVFLATICNMFAVMMVYKIWDMTTNEDLEFSVSNRESPWDVKELLDDRYDEASEYAGSTYALNHTYN